MAGDERELWEKTITLGCVSGEWKTAVAQTVVIPLFKGGRKDRRLPVNYRLISLTSCVARVREKIVNKRLQEYLRKNDLLYKHQSGFLIGHSTVTNCFT